VSLTVNGYVMEVALEVIIFTFLRLIYQHVSMRRFFSIGVLALGLTACGGDNAEPGAGTEQEKTGIVFFEGSWEEALAKAKSEGKLIFLDAYAEWCGPCHRMSENEFPNPKLGKFFNRHFINVKMDMERGVGPKLASRFSMTAYPTLYFIDCKGMPVSTNVGYRTADQLMDLGKIYFDQLNNDCQP
jgi:thioredoxin 1